MKKKIPFATGMLSVGIMMALSSATFAGAALKVGSIVDSSQLWEVPSQVTFKLYDSADAVNPVASQAFDAGLWFSGGQYLAGKDVRVSASFTNTDDLDLSKPLWLETIVDGTLVGSRQALAAEAPPVVDISAENFIEARSGGFIFPDNTVQTTAGIIAETDPNLAAHTANASAHHARYSDAEAVAAIKAADGSGSGLDADLLDGQHGSAFAAAAHSHAADFVNITGDTMTGKLTINSAEAGDFHGDLALFETDGTMTVDIDADLGRIRLFNGDGDEQILLSGDNSTGGFMRFRNEAGVSTITIDGDTSGDGRITTQELAITGGSDLSEQFDIDALKMPVVAGMLVSIDPQNPGKLIPSNEPYDHKVAGIVSGAGGVKPGMMMGQEGSIANGEYPVALTGRVYALVDTREGGEIKPGDLLTTSRVPGYAMKATDAERRSGAVIGKAMTSLKEEKGLVLVLVSLQ